MVWFIVIPLSHCRRIFGGPADRERWVHEWERRMDGKNPYVGKNCVAKGIAVFDGRAELKVNDRIEAGLPGCTGWFYLKSVL